MTGDFRGSGWSPEGERDRRPGSAMSIAPRAESAALDQPFDGDSLYAVRAAVAAHASAAGIPAGRVRDVVLAVHELAANAVRHGAGQGRVRLWVTGGGIRCEVTDAGIPSAGANGDRPDASSRDAAQWPVEHGHGLWLVRKVGDQASLESGPSGTVAVVTFRFASDRVTS
jgi:anti-sigma regulatory factor (Ser/Thr protein kinase)